MVEVLLDAIGAMTQPDRIEEVSKTLQEFAQSNKLEYISNLMAFISDEGISQQIKRNSLLLLYQIFPEDIAQESESTEAENFIPQEITQQILQLSHSFLTNPDGDLQNTAIHLYARVTSYYINLYELAPFHMLLETLMQSSDFNLATVYVNALCDILISYYPEEEETQALFRLVFTFLNLPNNIPMYANAIKIVNAMVENLSDFFDPSSEEIREENQQIIEGIASALLNLSGIQELQTILFQCWNKIGKYAPYILALHEQVLLQHALASLESTDRDLLFASCALIKRIAKVEIEDESEELNAIASMLQDVLAMIMDVCTSLDDPSCEANEVWEPYIAAHEALRAVCKLTADDIASAFGENFMQILSSDGMSFAERDCWLKLLEAVVVNTTDKNYVKNFIEVLLNLVQDESPCVRFRALRCIRKGLEIVSDENAADEVIAELSNNASDIANLLDDDGHIASEVSLILALFTKVPGFQNTADILQLLTEKAVSMHQHFAKEPFVAIDSIVTSGDADAVLAFFPTVCAYMESALNQPEVSWLVHDLGELMQAYCFRFKASIAPVCDHLCNLFIGVCQAESEYIPEVILPLSALSTTSHDVFSAHLPNVLEIFNTIFKAESELFYVQSAEHSSFYSAATGFSIIILENFQIENVPYWLEALSTSLSYQNMPTENKCAAVLALDSLAIRYNELYVPFAKTVLGYIRTYCQELGLKYGSDSDDSDGQRLAKSISQILLTTFKAIGVENIEQEHIEMTGELFLYLCQQDSVTSDLMFQMLSLMEFVGQNFHDFMAEMFLNNPDLLTKLENAAEYYDNCQQLVSNITTMFADLL